MDLNIGGANIHVRVAGQGDPILLLHGVPDSSEMWQGLMEKLSSAYTCYAPDLPGFDRSDIPSDYEYSLKSYGQFINRLVEALGIEKKLTLLMHDWGGIFGMSFASQYPQKVRNVVGGSFPFTPRYRWHAWARVWRTPVLGELSMLAMNKALFNWELKRGSSKLPGEHVQRTYDKLNWQTKRNILKLYRSANPGQFQQFEGGLEQLKSEAPIDLIWGENDIYVSPRYGDALAPRTQTQVPDAGHWVPVEAPEAILDALLPAN